MISLTRVVAFAFITISPSYSSPCDTECPQEKDVVCGFNPLSKTYKMYAGRCAMSKFIACNKFNEFTSKTVELYSFSTVVGQIKQLLLSDIVETPLSYCIKSDTKNSRKMYGDGESCPVFCPTHYRPVCGASKIRDYVYRAFTNGCQLDMLNCRGDEEVSGYVEVPLSFCPNHYMKNIFKDQIVGSNIPEYRDYDH
ncbi:kazal-type protease inhibitor m1 [Choristoneura fumiferana]|uniref:kazal-type protease inhibitor m1 n=1 Tax=Choristoneura fumiferana TaxID=7141 RepID=UPI003D157150